jgi:hypothetical protein
LFAALLYPGSCFVAKVLRRVASDAVLWSAASSRRFVMSRRAGMLFLLPLLLLLRRCRAVAVVVSVTPLSQHESVLLLAYYKAATGDGLPCSSSLRAWAVMPIAYRRRSATCESGESSPHSKGFACPFAVSVRVAPLQATIPTNMLHSHKPSPQRSPILVSTPGTAQPGRPKRARQQ